ncbi:unnamed protein product [Angiostrongylus costaricensis]|uniref:Large ribosomal subunit protein eL28 n=1 Tax=Angiostrongylus costaricensis TaxID=334426 RepID=A0A158PDT7_ANGCS|nr:unnamed protein product [Angiostrongylus costaricensis]
MSADLTWQIIRKNSCFLRRQKGIKKHFSVEPFNLRGINSRRYNGLISKRAMDLKPFKEGPGVTVRLKIPSKAAKPAKSKCVIALRNREKLLRSVKAIAKSQGLGHLHMLAQRRASAIFRSRLPKSKKHVKKIDA